MKNIKQQVSSFFRTVWKSLTDIRFYRGIRHKSVGETVAHLVVLISIAWLVPFLALFFLGARGTLVSFLGGFDRRVPAGTTFEVKKGVFSNSLDTPIVVRSGDAVIIVNTATSTLTFSDQEYGLILSQQEILERSGDGQDESAPFSKLPDFQSSKEQMLGRIRAAAPWAIGGLAFVALCVFALVSAFGVAAVTALHALLLWFLLRLFKKPLAYREAWILAAYAVTPLLLAKAILTLLSLDDGGLPMALYWVMLGFIAYDLLKGGPSDGRSQKAAGPDDGTSADNPHA